MSTSIEWTRNSDGSKGETWNPTTGCDRVSPGCDHCYALTMAGRLKGMGSEKYQNDGDPRTSGPGFGVTVHEDALAIPLRWKKPRTVFVNSMSDLFHARVPREFVVRVFAVMAATPQHTYQILTKRPQRAAKMLLDLCKCGAGHPPNEHFRAEMEWASSSHSPTYVPGLKSGIYHRMQWPLPNVWIGTSAENQEYANQRIPALLETPAAVRFISAEPLLGPIDFDQALTSREASRAIPEMPLMRYWLDWVIVGGESGPGARPMEEAWAADIAGQCQTAGVPVFIKQMGKVWAQRFAESTGARNDDPKGGEMWRWPEPLRVREMPEVARA